MALTYASIPVLAANTTYLAQVQAAILKYAMTRILASVNGAELAFCAAIIKSPTSYTTRFLTDILIVNAAALTSTNGTSLDAAPSDATVDSAVAAHWQAQVSAGA